MGTQARCIKLLLGIQAEFQEITGERSEKGREDEIGENLGRGISGLWKGERNDEGGTSHGQPQAAWVCGRGWRV